VSKYTLKEASQIREEVYAKLAQKRKDPKRKWKVWKRWCGGGTSEQGDIRNKPIG
jgi:hypothetical protein